MTKVSVSDVTHVWECVPLLRFQWAQTGNVLLTRPNVFHAGHAHQFVQLGQLHQMHDNYTRQMTGFCFNKLYGLNNSYEITNKKIPNWGFFIRKGK